MEKSGKSGLWWLTRNGSDLPGDISRGERNALGVALWRRLPIMAKQIGGNRVAVIAIDQAMDFLGSPMSLGERLIRGMLVRTLERCATAGLPVPQSFQMAVPGYVGVVQGHVAARGIVRRMNVHG